MSPAFKAYYIGTMGYHVNDIFMHLLHPARNDFVEMFLHHIVTISLYGFSYMTSFIPAGALVMFFHDLSDTFTAMARCFTETTFKKMIAVSGVLMLASWFYTRLLVFPFVIYYGCFRVDIFKGAGFFGGHFFGYLLSVLFVMHVYWFSIMIRSVGRYFKTGATDDLH